MHRKKLLFIFGTRPEAIKMAPLIRQFKKKRDRFNVLICVTAQHREMLDQVLNFFELTPDYDLNLMKPNQSLFDVTAEGLKGLERVLHHAEPDIVFIQGDTTTAFVGALAAYYAKKRIAHIEAGLRSGDKSSPFPEEANRILAGHLSDFHFAPTERAKRNLLKEGIQKNIWVVGNTVIDSVFLGLGIIQSHHENDYMHFFRFLDFTHKVILVTGHRRESFGRPFESICEALKELVSVNNDVEIVYPVHLNPNVREPVNRILGGLKRVHLIEPIDYPHLIWLMKRSYLVLTDSGGIQEEAPSLGKPVLVMRDVTERIEGVDAGTAKLVGTDKEAIIREVSQLLTDEKDYARMSKAINPYGDGKTSERIVSIIDELI